MLPQKKAKNTTAQVITTVEKGTSTVYGDGKEAVSTLYNDAKSMAPKIVDGITEIAKGLKITADSVWGILVKQQKVWSIGFLIVSIGSLINWFLFYRRCVKIVYTDKKGRRTIKEFIDNPDFDESYYEANKKHINATYSSDREKVDSVFFKKKIMVTNEIDCLIARPPVKEPFSGFKYVHLAICIAMSAFSIFHFGDMLTGFMNPEYGAMKDVLLVALKIKQTP
jgi:hypothetical protein